MPKIRDALDALRREERQLAAALESVRDAIAALTDSADVPSRPGLKQSARKTARKIRKKVRTMTAAQRQAVSDRMKKYWAGRKRAAKR